MKTSGAVCLSRIAALLLTAMICITTCLPPVSAAGIWDELILNVVWTDDDGQVHSVPAQPVQASAERAYWVTLDPAARNRRLAVEAVMPDPAYSFYFMDDIGGMTQSFTWTEEQDASDLSPVSAYTMYYAVNGYQQDVPLLLYVSSAEMPEVDAFEPFPVEVQVDYRTEDGALLDRQYTECWAGETTPVWAASTATTGYTLLGAEVVHVTVDQDGRADPAEIVFIYRQDAVPTPTEAPTATPVAEVSVPVAYYHINGSTLDFQELYLTPGTHTIHASSANADGYVLVSDEAVTITVYPDGSTDLASVTFYYTDPAVVEATVPVHYLHVSKGPITSTTVTLPVGTHTIYADESQAGGLYPVGSTSVEVTVYADGTFHPGTVDFFFEDPYTEPVTATLTILYCLPDGTVIAQDTRELIPGAHSILPDDGKTPGYRLDENQGYLVEVAQDGSISAEVVSFYCRPAAVTVTVHYQDDLVRDVAPTQHRTFEEDGEYVIHAEPEGLSVDYELAPGTQPNVTITVSGGKASTSDVYFYYRLKKTAPASAVVMVGYFDVDHDGDQYTEPQSVTLSVGTHQLKPDASYVPAGYELVSDDAITVEVYENGTFSPQQIAFYYRKVQESAQMAAVEVLYLDDRGNAVADRQTIQLPNGTHIIEPHPENLLPGYTLLENLDSQASVTVRGGVANQSRVVFYYHKSATAREFTIPVSYYDTQGRIIATTQHVTVTPGAYTIQANPADLPSGYELMMESSLYVQVFEDGTTDPEEIAFYYRPPEKLASIMVSYVDTQGRSITNPFRIELAAGYHTIQAEPARVPSGYDPASAKPVQVFVSADGTAEPDRVVLTFVQQAYETPIPVGEHVYRYATINGNEVALRTEPSTARKDTVIKRLSKNSKVYVLQELTNDKNEVWAYVMVDGQYGYMMSKYVQIMTQAQSDAYAAGSSPAPTFTPVPVATPTPTPFYEPTQGPIEVITPPPTATPTLEPLPDVTVTAAPADSTAAAPSPTRYAGYALVTRATELRSGISSSPMSVIQGLAANELVYVVDQKDDLSTGEMWAIVTTLNRQSGFVQESALRRITDKEAEPYLRFWEAQNRSPEPTELITATPEPMQQQGYGVVLLDGTPFRQMASEYSRIIDNLPAEAVVYIEGQTASNGQYWHSVNYQGRWGYIRADLVRMMTIVEQEEYLDRLYATPTPEPVTTNLPFDPNGLSSYGYVDAGTVNWREAPSTGSKRVGELKRYALCLVLGTERVNGTTWYLVSYNDKTGYIHGDYFKHLSINELEQFRNSDRYVQGVQNNAPTGSSSMDDVGFTGMGGIVSAEDQTVNRYPDVYVSTKPFQPSYNTPQPIGTPTLEPLPGVTATPTASPTFTPVFNPLPDVTYPTAQRTGGSPAFVWVLVAGLILMVVGGVFGLVRYQQKRRRIALRAAQRRAQAARAQQRPYARNAQGQPRMGMYPDPQGGAYGPEARQGQATGKYSPYADGRGNAAGSYARAMQQSPYDPQQEDTQHAQRVGRRTAYRQSQQQKQRDTEE